MSRIPKAAARSKRSALLASKKWKCEPTWMGRSPVLATTSSTVRRPSKATTSPSPSRYSPGIIATRSFSRDGMVDGHELGAVGERAFDLHVLDHLRHALHDVLAGQDLRPPGHELGRALAVADPLQHLGGDEGHRLGMVELEPARPPPPRQIGSDYDQQLFLLAWRQMHARACKST